MESNFENGIDTEIRLRALLTLKHKRNHRIVSLSIKPTISKGADIRVTVTGVTVADVDSKLTDEEIKRNAVIAAIANDLR